VLCGFFSDQKSKSKIKGCTMSKKNKNKSVEADVLTTPVAEVETIAFDTIAGELAETEVEAEEFAETEATGDKTISWLGVFGEIVEVFKDTQIKDESKLSSSLIPLRKWAVGPVFEKVKNSENAEELAKEIVPGLFQYIQVFEQREAKHRFALWNKLKSEYVELSCLGKSKARWNKTVREFWNETNPDNKFKGTKED
jgi:hypothetical protein